MTRFVSQEVIDGLIERDGSRGFVETWYDAVDLVEFVWIPQRPRHPIDNVYPDHEKRVRPTGGVAIGFVRIAQVCVRDLCAPESTKLEKDFGEQKTITLDMRQTCRRTRWIGEIIRGEKLSPEMDGIEVRFVTHMFSNIDRVFPTLAD